MTAKELIAQAIQECNETIFSFMWQDTPLTQGSPQHRDLIRVYFAGRVDALIARGAVSDATILLGFVQIMLSDEWVPGILFTKENVRSK